MVVEVVESSIYGVAIRQDAAGRRGSGREGTVERKKVQHGGEDTAGRRKHGRASRIWQGRWDVAGCNN